MKRILLTFIFVIFFNVQAYALELLMFHSKYCGYCMAFMKEVAVDYEYRDMPLVIIDAYNQADWFKEAYKENRILNFIFFFTRFNPNRWFISPYIKVVI